MKKIRRFITTALLCAVCAFGFTACGGGGGGGGDGGNENPNVPAAPFKNKIFRFEGAYVNEITFVTESTVEVQRDAKAYAGSYTCTEAAGEYSLTIDATHGSNGTTLKYVGRVVFSDEAKTRGMFHYTETLGTNAPQTGCSQAFSVVSEQ